MKQQGIAASLAVAKEDAKLKQLPEWIDRSTCQVNPVQGKRSGWQLSFHCDCSVAPVRVGAKKPRAGWDDAKIATMLRASYDSSKHPHCADRGTATAAASTPREQQLEGALKKSKRKLVEAASANELLQAQVNNGAAQKKACTEAARQETSISTLKIRKDSLLPKAQQASHKMVNKLNINEFVAFQDRTNQSHTFPYWIAQTIDSGNGSCIIKQYTERETIDGVCFTRGDYVLAVKW
jgi:hypothetical protein